MVNPSTSWYHARLLPRSFTVSETESMLAWKDSDSACLVAPSGTGELVLMDPPVVMRLVVIYCVLFCLLVNSEPEAHAPPRRGPSDWRNCRAPKKHAVISTRRSPPLEVLAECPLGFGYCPLGLVALAMNYWNYALHTSIHYRHAIG